MMYFIMTTDVLKEGEKEFRDVTLSTVIPHALTTLYN